jgi:hypothetical protein
MIRRFFTRSEARLLSPLACRQRISIRLCSDGSSSSELKSKLQNNLEARKLGLANWQPGKKLTNSELLTLFHSYEKKKRKSADPIKNLLQHPLLRIYGFERREFISGCKQALQMISESISSPRYRAHLYGATHSCSESDFLQSISTPQVCERWKGLLDESKFGTLFQNNFVGKFLSTFTQVNLPLFKISRVLLTFNRLEYLTLSSKCTTPTPLLPSFLPSLLALLLS